MWIMNSWICKLYIEFVFLTKVDNIYLQVEHLPGHEQHNCRCTQKRAGEAKKCHLPWPTNSSHLSWLLNSFEFSVFFAWGQEWRTSGQKIVTFQPLPLIHHNCCLESGSNVHRCPNKKRESRYVRYLMPENLIIDAFVTFCFPSHLSVLLCWGSGRVFLTVFCCFRCGLPCLPVIIGD